ncbi:MAG: GTPase ObgE [Deltaproteobacteria bacterium]|nr:GTPase ObgE [Deltaproteobacteria bacterium]
MQFIDQATIYASSGAGGHGSKSFRREKYIPRGGPDGGDGGRGGDVVVVGDQRSRSLLDFHFNRHYQAENGAPGADSRKTGRDGADLLLTVPPGTQVYDADTGELLGDVVEQDQRLTILRGGNGGWGNVHFATATRQAPDRANPGQPGQTRRLRLELKLLADVALVGFPNVGKSSLIRSISASRAEVADYPFTTLVPNLGVVRHRGRTFTVADIPGLIEGAAGGAGLGIRFLQHIERCKTLCFLLVQGEEPEPLQALAILRRELAAYSPELAGRPAVYCLAKADTLGPDAEPAAQELSRQLGAPVFAISPVTGAGIGALLNQLADQFTVEAPTLPSEWSPLDP